MKSFVKINLGNEVFDSSQSIKGIVTQINYRSGVAEISVIPSTENEKVLCRLTDLTVINSGKGEDNLEIKVKYFNKESTRLSKISQGDWIDLRASETISIKKGEFKLIPLGVAMKLPDGYEAIVAPRSSTFKNFGVIETNSIGVIDNSYSGNGDQWFFPAYALRDTTINFDERICQFRIQKSMPKVNINEVEKLDDEDRGGHGSTGVK